MTCCPRKIASERLLNLVHDLEKVEGKRRGESVPSALLACKTRVSRRVFSKLRPTTEAKRSIILLSHWFNRGSKFLKFVYQAEVKKNSVSALQLSLGTFQVFVSWASSFFTQTSGAALGRLWAPDNVLGMC